MKYTVSNLPIFFILSKGKSGSTLLQTIFDAHPHIVAPIESRFFIHLYPKYADQKKWNKKKLTQFYEDLFLDEKINFLWEIDREKLKKELLNQPLNTNFGTLCKIVYSNYISIFNKKEINLIGDKNPIHSLFIKKIKNVFPDAKFIHLVRDPRGTTVSHLKSFPQKNIYFAGLKWVEHNKCIEQEKVKIPSKFYTIKYEDLVTKPEYYTKELCNFLEIDFNESMLAHSNAVNQKIVTKLEERRYTSKNNLKYELFKKDHKNLSKPINASAIYKWKEKLTYNQIKLIEGITEKGMKIYHYERIFKENNLSISKKELIKHFIWKNRIKIYYSVPFAWRKLYTQYINNSSQIPDIK